MTEIYSKRVYAPQEREASERIICEILDEIQKRLETIEEKLK
jgi:hypothetical protein